MHPGTAATALLPETPPHKPAVFTVYIVCRGRQQYLKAPALPLQQPFQFLQSFQGLFCILCGKFLRVLFYESSIRC